MRGKRNNERRDLLEFSNRCPQSEAALKHKVVRASAKTGLKITILSKDMIGHQVHFRDRRGQPCWQNPCPHCMAGNRRQFEAYFWCRSIRTDELAMGCVPPTGALALEGIFNDLKTLRGVSVHLYRVPAEPNGRVFARLLDFDPHVKVPDNLARVEDFLQMLWRVRVQTESPATNDPIARMEQSQLNDAMAFGGHRHQRILGCESNGVH